MKPRLMNLRTGKTSKPGHLYLLQGKSQEEVKEAIAGDIVAVPKCDDLHISDTVTAAANGHTPRLALDPIRFPTPMVPRAVEPKTREDEPKISAGLAKIADEDPTFTYPTRHPDARAGDLGDERTPPRRDPEPAQDPVQDRHQHARPPRPLPGDDRRRSRGAPSPQEADRRPWPVRRRPAPRPAPGSWRGVLVRRRGERAA